MATAVVVEECVIPGLCSVVLRVVLSSRADSILFERRPHD